MAFKQNNRDLQTQESQFMEMFLNLSKGQEELKALLNRNLTKKHPDNNKDDQLKQLQAEMEGMRIQMISQMALIQNLARGQEELRALVNKFHQDRCNHMEQTTRTRDRVFNQP